MSNVTAEQITAAMLHVIETVGDAEPRSTGEVICSICSGHLAWHTTHRSLYGKCSTPDCIDFHSRGKYKKKTIPVRQDKLL